MRVVFVCTGNTCRSPMAAGFLTDMCLPGLTVESRGLYADGAPVSPNAVTAMRDYGIDISSHRSVQLTPEDLSADRIICLAPSHRAALLAAGAKEDRLLLLGDGISDPYGGNEAVYRLCCGEIYRAVNELAFGGAFTPFCIRPAEREHLPGMAILEKECFSEPWSEQALFESMQAGTRFFTALSDGRIVGYIGVSAVADEGYFTNVAVTADCRGMGVGTMLINRAIALARERALAFLSLEVRRSNQAAIALYQKLGFRVEGERRGFYRDPLEDALIMTRRFTETNEDFEH